MLATFVFFYLQNCNFRNLGPKKLEKNEKSNDYKEKFIKNIVDRKDKNKLICNDYPKNNI